MDYENVLTLKLQGQNLIKTQKILLIIYFFTFLTFPIILIMNKNPKTYFGKLPGTEVSKKV